MSFRSGALVLVVAVGLAVPCGAAITISGTVSGPSGPLADAPVIGWSDGGEPDETVTAADGSYSLSVSPGMVGLMVRPAIETRLVQRSMILGQLDSSMQVDVALQAGALLSGAVLEPDGTSLQQELAVDVRPVVHPLEASEWLSAEVLGGTFRLVVPVDVVWLRVSGCEPLYSPHVGADARSGDVAGIEIHLQRRPSPPFPVDPPNASRISVGGIDGVGEAAVTGAAGAAMPYSRVLVVNLGSGQQETSVAAADGSFSVRVFAPPGSPLYVKHGAPDDRWLELANGLAEHVNPYPGTVLHVPFGGWPRFAAVGAAGITMDDDWLTRNTVGTAFWLEGEIVGGRIVQAGSTVQAVGQLHLYSPAFDATTDSSAISSGGWVSLAPLVDADGKAVEAMSSYLSGNLTSTGLPVQSGLGLGIGVPAEITVGSFSRVGEHAFEADWQLDLELPEDLPSGTYRPRVEVFVNGVPSSSEWIAAHLFGATTHPADAVLAPIVVGSQPPSVRLPWHLGYEHPTLGTRGTRALEDSDWFQLAPQIVTQGAPHLVPPFDLATGEPITYRLEPFIPMIAFTDRRLPSRPWIPLRLPGGELTVEIERPDGSFVGIGPEPFMQSFSRTATTFGGADLNPGTQQMNDAYSLTTNDPAFRVELDQYGLHRVEMVGIVEDVWGITYEGGGTYELWVAHPLDIDPGVLPGTPLEVGDAINPSVQLHPPVPATIELTVTLDPDSDPDRRVVKTITGEANQYGVFAGAAEALTVDQAGEVRVDLVASYTAPDGTMFMGAMRWGGIVMTPPAEVELVAHGRRGVDCMTTVPAAWLVFAEDLDLEGVCHTYNAYHNGDVLWSRLSDGEVGGDALLAVGTVQDPFGGIGDTITSRLRGMIPELDDEMEERLAAGELPLYSTTSSGEAPRLFPSELEQIAYSYRSSQRPGVRVREMISDDSHDGGYWRLDTLYDDQPGVGLLGDQPHDFKFQYVGVVYHDVVNDIRQYVGQGSGWVFIPDDDPAGTRVMPPFAGPGNGGWTTRGGPLLTHDGEEIHLLVVLTGTHPGAVLEVGETFRLAGHLMPTLPSQVDLTLTAPDGSEHSLEVQANSVGYFYDPTQNVVVDQAGVWTAELTAWHDGTCSGGHTMAPYPSGTVLGADDGRFEVYVVPAGSEPLQILSPRAGRLTFADAVHPISVRGRAPVAPQVAYTITMPGWILEQGMATTSGDSFEIVYDPVTLQQRFPNIDLVGRDAAGPGLADTVLITMYANQRAATVSLEGQQVAVGDQLLPPRPRHAGGRAGR